MRTLTLLAMISVGTLAGRARAQDATSHSLFDPTPREQMRELSTDRPDTTESAHTVDAGHFQLEMDTLVFVYDRSGPAKTTGYTLAPTNLKLGLVDSTDVQLVVEPYHRITTRALGASHVDDGYGATTLRVKTNLWGNDGGSSALALMPFVTYVDDGVDAGLIVPFAFDLPAGFGAGGIVEADLIRRSTGSRGVDLVGTAELAHDLFSTLAGYVELASVLPLYDIDATSLAIHAGLTLGLSDYLQLDAGGRFGAIGPVADAEIFQGVSGKL